MSEFEHKQIDSAIETLAKAMESDDLDAAGKQAMFMLLKAFFSSMMDIRAELHEANRLRTIQAQALSAIKTDIVG